MARGQQPFRVGPEVQVQVTGPPKATAAQPQSGEAAGSGALWGWEGLPELRGLIVAMSRERPGAMDAEQQTYRGMCGLG
ncbi:hypothetical protein WJX75_000595 [Coccomyxa subellipsoidea]|uniref:Uncharacterized protein n=1 Tax=Coccomyxa subellipsoidea TaxID=248742 RepID=A0ABR2YQU2_9CHLO